MTDRDPPATVAELEAGLRQLHRMEMQTKLNLERLETLLAATIKVLHRAEMVDEAVIETEADNQRVEMMETRYEEARVVVGPGVDKYAVVSPQVDCASLMHLCKARCCRLSVALDFADLDEGLRWDYARPYELRRRPADGYCVYSHPTTRRCECYDKRPAVCRTYDCRQDSRVWEDFAAKKPAPWRDEVGVPQPLVQLRVPVRPK